MATTAKPTMSLDDYIGRTQQYAAGLLQEMETIKEAREAGLELALEEGEPNVAHFRGGPLHKKLVSSDYSRATIVEIKEEEPFLSLADYGWKIHFRFSLPGGIPVYCRQEGWRDEPMSWAQRKYKDDFCASDPSFTRVRKNPETVVDFYQEKGVAEALLTELRGKLEELYREPLAEWERSMSEEEWAEELPRLQRKMEEMIAAAEQEAEQDPRGRL